MVVSLFSPISTYLLLPRRSACGNLEYSIFYGVHDIRFISLLSRECQQAIYKI